MRQEWRCDYIPGVWNKGDETAEENQGHMEAVGVGALDKGF